MRRRFVSGSVFLHFCDLTMVSGVCVCVCVCVSRKRLFFGRCRVVPDVTERRRCWDFCTQVTRHTRVAGSVSLTDPVHVAIHMFSSSPRLKQQQLHYQ